MTASGDRASEQGRFAAREFIARFVRETGVSPDAVFAYEMGYLRGRSDAGAEAIALFDEVSRSHEDQARKDSDAGTTDTDETK